MELTKRQAIFLVIICLMANKVQRLPSLISTAVGRHGWLAFAVMGFIDIVFLIVTLNFNKKAKGLTTYEVCEKAGGKWFAKLTYIGLGIYFLLNSLLPYEAIHDLFANILFDNLSWEIYSILLALAVFFISSRGLKNLGRLGELYFYIIGVSFIILLTLGAVTTNYYHVLPLYDINGSAFIETCLKYNLWFGDFLMIYMFVGKIKVDKNNLGWPCVVVFASVVVLISFSYAVFYGLYENLSTNQNNLISAISQFSLVGLDIGRVDWFLVLFFQISTLISSSVYLFLTSECIKEVFGLKKNTFICFILAAIVYSMDILIFKSVQAGAGIVAEVSQYFSLFMIIGFPIIMFISVLVKEKKNNKKFKKIPENYSKFSFLIKRNPKLHIFKKNQLKKQENKKIPSKLKEVTYEENN